MSASQASVGPLQSDPELARAGEVLRRLGEAWARMAPPPPSDLRLEVAAERVRNGIPALAEEPLLDGAGLRQAVEALAEALATVEGYEGTASLGERLLSSSLDWDELARIALAGAWYAVEGTARRLDAEPEALAVLLDYAVRPAIRAAARTVRPVIAEAQWTQGTCPACGAPPLLSVTTGKEAARFLLCGRCGTSWSWPRTRCASCGESDHRKLGFLHTAGEGDFRRVEVCDTCRGYLKTVSVLDLPDPDRLLRLDLETAALDFMALDAGYTRAGGGAPA